MKTALLLIDIQMDYFPGGRMEVEGSLEASLKAKEALRFFRREKRLVVHVRHISGRPGATFFLPGTPGIEIHENVAPLPGETVISKNYPNGFRQTGLLDVLKAEGIGRVVIAGMMTHMCVDSTTRAAFDYGFECAVLSDACAARALSFGSVTVQAPHVHAAFLAALGAVYARVATTEGFIADPI